MSDKSQRIFAVDPGSHIAGFACLEASSHVLDVARGMRVVDAGVLRMDSQLSAPDRIMSLHLSLLELFKELKPNVCVIEKAFFGINALSALRLGEVRGAVMAACAVQEIPIVEMTPTKVKKMVAGSGRAKKEEVSLSLEALLNFKRGKLPHDVTDAVALAFTHGIESRLALP